MKPLFFSQIPSEERDRMTPPEERDVMPGGVISPVEGMRPQTGRQNRGTPAVPIPNPGEGGPVFEGNPPAGNEGMQGNNSGMPGSGPMIPLPNPGEGGAVYPGPGETVNANPPGLNIPAIIGTIITGFPRPNAPCRFCTNPTQVSGNVRFLNAAAGYNPFTVYIGDQLFVEALGFSELTSYEKIPSGYRIVTVMGENQYIYIQKPLMIPREENVTVAICNTPGGLDLFVVRDSTCSKRNYLSCMRVCNLASGSGPLSVTVGNNQLRFPNIAYQEVTEYRILPPSPYVFYVLNQNRNILLASGLNVQSDVSLTLYLLQWNPASPDAVTALIVEEHHNMQQLFS